MEVHRELGSGFLEAVYQEAIEREFSDKEIPFQSQPTVQTNGPNLQPSAGIRVNPIEGLSPDFIMGDQCPI